MPVRPRAARRSAAYADYEGTMMKKNDKDDQIKMLEKAVQLDPDNQQLKRQLGQVKASK